MSRAPWIFFGIIAVLAVGDVTVLILQRQAERDVGRHLALEREQNRELNRLRAERRRLVSAQANEGEVNALSEDRAALDRLRGEIDALKNRAKESARADEPKKTGPAAFIPASDWKN